MNKLALAIGSFAVAATGILAAGDEPYLLEDLSVWLRADKGLSTNSVGGVTAWANQGTLGAAVDVAPHTDNSAGHVAYEASGIGGKPSLAFDGSVYLKTDAATDLGMTADGGAWFVVYKTPCTRTERANMGIMGSNYNNGGIRFGSFSRTTGMKSAKTSSSDCKTLPLSRQMPRRSHVPCSGRRMARRRDMQLRATVPTYPAPNGHISHTRQYS